MSSKEENAKELINSLNQEKSNLKKEEYIIKAGQKLYNTTMFENMGLNQSVLQSLFALRHDKPSLIQSVATPLILEGKNVSVQSKSGTGKTAAYAIGVLHKITMGVTSAIILSPTHELNTQICENIQIIGKKLGAKVIRVVKRKDITRITEEIVVGGPRLVFNLIQDGIIDASKIKIIVVDEADATLTPEGGMGMEAMRILRACDLAQKVFFSATFTDQIKEIIFKTCSEIEEIYEAKNEKPEEIKIFHIEMNETKKLDILLKLYDILPIAQSIVFCGTRDKVDLLKNVFVSNKFAVSFLHGKMEHSTREEEFNKFKNAKTKVLVTTDVFGRGMDVTAANLIINFDMPGYKDEDFVQTYIHRIGRGGRFGRAGFVIDFVSSVQDYKIKAQISEKLMNLSKETTIEALEKEFEKTVIDDL